MIQRNLRAACVLAVAVSLGALAGPAQADMFPPAGQDMMHGVVTIEIELIGALFNEPDPIPVLGTFSGPTVIQRGDPIPDTSGGGDYSIQTEIVSMSLTGQVDVTGLGVLPGVLTLRASHPSLGRITDTNPDPGSDFPAQSYFDVFLEVTAVGTPFGDVTLLNDLPVRMYSLIDEIPPKLWLTPYVSDPMAPVVEVHLPTGQLAGVILMVEYSPEPGSLTLLALGALGLIRRRRK